ncbi:hypothetical protein HGRIS_004814 [Hohenbuehelia grisea]|uniref:Protein kinase domain-containing protein n=1 Tax=Hohenbuehelia grisea TaxID=104357 RepID=A0ABR3JEC0_9AGAR
MRSLKYKKGVPFTKVLPQADEQAIDLVSKMLTFDPSKRITVPQALEHPWLAGYHDDVDEPICDTTFDKWQELEKLETIEEYREALWKEIEDYRREARGIKLTALPPRPPNVSTSVSVPKDDSPKVPLPSVFESASAGATDDAPGSDTRTEPDVEPPTMTVTEAEKSIETEAAKADAANLAPPSAADDKPVPDTPRDPVVTYARRSSIMQPPRTGGSTFSSPLNQTQQLPSFTEGPCYAEPGAMPSTGTAGGINQVAFPTQGFVVPARSRTASMAGGEVTRKLLRTLSTVSIHETGEGVVGGLAQIAPIGKYIVNRDATEADEPASEVSQTFGINEASEEEEDDRAHEKEKEETEGQEKKGSKFRIH